MSSSRQHGDTVSAYVGIRRVQGYLYVTLMSLASGGAYVAKKLSTSLDDVMSAVLSGKMEVVSTRFDETCDPVADGDNVGRVMAP
jgi:hypothetical protein